jgi:hypothetical protein
VAESLMKAGDRLYVGGKSRVAAFDLHSSTTVPSWEVGVSGAVSRVVAADDRLFAVTREEAILCFGGESVTPRQHALPAVTAEPEDAWTRRAAELLKTTGVREGSVSPGASAPAGWPELVRQSAARHRCRRMPGKCRRFVNGWRI